MKEFVTYFIAACIITFLCCILCRTTRELSLLGKVIINLIFSVVLSNIAMFVIYRKNSYYNQMVELVDRITKFKFTRVLKIIKK